MNHLLKLVHKTQPMIATRTFITFIKTSQIGIKQTFGREGGMFNDQVIAQPGLRVYLPIFQTITAVSTRIMQDTYCFETKTKDNVFTSLNINVQYQIKPENARTAFFTLTNIGSQTKTYVENVVRSLVSNMTLDSTFNSQHEISEKVFNTLKDKMLGYGVTIVDTLVTEIIPDSQVKEAMNRINASERNMIAAKNEADADYIKKVRHAEADAERKRLNGVGISGMRKEIVEGYINSISQASHDLNVTASDVMSFVKSIQELDVREAIGSSNNTKILFVPERSQTIEQLHHVLEASKSKPNSK